MILEHDKVYKIVALIVYLISQLFSPDQISLSDPPKVELSFGSNIVPSNIAEGNDVYLDCDIRAHPKAYKVVWMHDVST